MLYYFLFFTSIFFHSHNNLILFFMIALLISVSKLLINVYFSLTGFFLINKTANFKINELNILCIVNYQI